MAKTVEGERLSAQDVALAAFVDLLDGDAVGPEIRLCATRDGDQPLRWRVEIPASVSLSLSVLERFRQLTIDRPVRVDYDFDRRCWLVRPKAVGE